MELVWVILGLYRHLVWRVARGQVRSFCLVVLDDKVVEIGAEELISRGIGHCSQPAVHAIDLTIRAGPEAAPDRLIQIEMGAILAVKAAGAPDQHRLLITTLPFDIERGPEIVAPNGTIGAGYSDRSAVLEHGHHRRDSRGGKLHRKFHRQGRYAQAQQVRRQVPCLKGCLCAPGQQAAVGRWRTTDDNDMVQVHLV